MRRHAMRLGLLGVVAVVAVVACRAAEPSVAIAPEVPVAPIASSSPVVDASVDSNETAPPPPAPVEVDAAAPRRTPPPVDPRPLLTWDDLAIAERSVVACRTDKECVVEIETPQCTCCSYPLVVAIHVREKKKGALPPQPPCMPACAAADRPCRALPDGSPSDYFRARCDGAKCRLERR